MTDNSFGVATFGTSSFGTTPAPGIDGSAGSSFADAVWLALGLDMILDDYQANLITARDYIDAIGQAFQQLDNLAHVDSVTGDPQWSILMDIDRIPDEGLPWFGQFTGVVVDGSLSVQNQRLQIKRHQQWYRGSVDALKNEIQTALTGTKTVTLTERDTSAYHFLVETAASETPDSSLVDKIISKYKPAGLQYTYTVTGSTTAHTYVDVYNDFATYSALYATELTYEDLYINP